MKATRGTWELLEGTRRTSWLAMLLAIALYAAVLPVSNLARFGPIGALVDDLEQTTNGCVAVQLAYPWITLCLVSVAIFGVGRLRAKDVGWRARAVITAFAVTILFWMSVQASLMVVVLHSGEDLRWGSWWAGRDGSVLGSLADQVLGPPLVEETFFRGFLLPQIFLQASRTLRRWPSLLVALLVSSSLFTLSHVPRLRIEGVAGQALTDELLWNFPWGLFLALVFLVTKNLFLCVGLHSLWNARPTLIEIPWETVKGVWWVLTSVLLVAWWLGTLYRGRSHLTGP